MTQTAQLSRRGFLIFVFFLALAMGVTTGIGSGWARGLGSFAVVMGFWLVLAFLPKDLLPLLRPGRAQDDRELDLGKEAAALTGIVMVFVALIGAMWNQASTGSQGEFGLMAVVGGLTFLVASVLLPRFR